MRPQQSTGRPPSKAQAPVDDDEDEDIDTNDEDDDDDVEEETKPQPKSSSASKFPSSKPKPKQTVEVDDEDEEDDIDEEMANAFNAVPTSSNADGIPVGKYEAIISEIVWQPWTELKGKSIRMKFELCDPDYANQNVVTRWFKIFDGNKQTMDVGISIFRQSMAKLGYEVEDVRKLNKLFKQVMEDRPGVLLNISYRTYQGTQYIDPKIEGGCDNDVVQEYKDSVAY